MLGAHLVCQYSIDSTNIRKITNFPKSRRALLGAAAVATVVTETPREKLPIYPAPEPKLILIDTPSELERKIGYAREKLTTTYSDSYAYVQSWIDRWIAVEHAVESASQTTTTPCVSHSLTVCFLDRQDKEL